MHIIYEMDRNTTELLRKERHNNPIRCSQVVRIVKFVKTVTDLEELSLTSSCKSGSVSMMATLLEGGEIGSCRPIIQTCQLRISRTSY